MRFSTAFAAAFALAASASAFPTRFRRTDYNAATQSPNIPTFSNGVSFNNYGGRQQSSNFDNFYGHGNFVGRFNQEIIVEERTVCDQVDIEVIQQKLAVILENAKRILIEEVCDFETQVIIHEQFHGRSKDFGKDIQRKSGRRAGYDRDVAGRYGSLYQSNGDRMRTSLGFDGWNIGKQQVRLGQGSSGWDNNSSPAIAKQAKKAAEQAAKDQRPDSEKKPSKQMAQPAPVPVAAPMPSDSTAVPAPVGTSAPVAAMPATPQTPAPVAAPAPVASQPAVINLPAAAVVAQT